MAITKVFEAINKRVPGRGKPPVLLKIRSSEWFITMAVCIGIFSDMFLYGVIVPVVPFALTKRANVPQQDVQHWVSVLFAAFGAALLVSSPICGVLADHTKSRRAPLLFGLLILLGSTVMLCFGKSIPVFVIGRLLQGASSGLVWTVGMALIADTVKGPGLGRAMGFVATSYSIGLLIAPLLGGIVYKQSGYYAVFGMAFAVVGLDIVLRLLLIEKKYAVVWTGENRSLKEDNKPTSDLEETSSEAAPSQPLSGAEHEKAVEMTQMTPQTSRKKRMIPPILLLLKSRRILAAFWGNLAVASMMTAFDTVLPLFVHRTFGWDSLGAGLVFFALIVPEFGGPLVGHVTEKYGPRWIAASGLILSMPFWVLLRLVDHHNIGQIVLLCALLLCLGISIAMVITSLMTEFSKVCDAIERQQPELFGSKSAYAQAYGIFNIAWAGGSLIGPLWAAGVEKRAGWKTMTWTLGLFGVLSAIPVLLFSGGWIARRKLANRGRDEIW